MPNLIKTITPVEWGLLGIAVVALLFAFMAWRRAGQALQLAKSQPVVDEARNEEAEQQLDQPPAVSLEMSANKDEFEQVFLNINNAGQLAARQVKISIDKPENVYDAESLGAGIESADVTTSSAIMPRLAVLDAENKLPANEILPGKTIVLPAVLTMSHGKICDFPVSLVWLDENGTSHQKKLTLTI